MRSEYISLYSFVILILFLLIQDAHDAVDPNNMQIACMARQVTYI